MKILSLLQIILLYLGILVAVECHLGDQIAKLLHKSKIQLDRAGQLVENCGESYHDIPETENKTHALPNEFPWHVSVQHLYNGTFQHHCDGAIIHERYILTADHCTWELKPYEILIGASLYDLDKPHTANSQYRSVSKIYTEQYRNGEYYDIAVLELTDRLEMQPGIDSAICLPTGDQVFTDKMAAAGWNRRKMSKILQKVQLDRIDLNECKKRYLKGYDGWVVNCTICTITPNYKTACEGDFGGTSIMCVDQKSKKTFACGVMAWGSGCGIDGSPGLAVDTSCFTSWINDDMSDKK